MKIILSLALFALLSIPASAQNRQKAVEAYNQGLTLQSRGLLKEAVAAYDVAIQNDPRMLDAYNNRSNIKLELGDRDGALADLTKAVEATNGHALSFYNRGNLYLSLEDNDKAIADFTKAIDMLNGLTNNYDKRAHAMSHNNRGNALSAKGDYKSAMPDYNRSLEILPKSLEALTSRGAAFQQLGDHKSAVADYTLALEIAPKSTLVLYNRASALEEVDKSASITDYTALISLMPENANAYARRGLMFLELKRKAEAAADLRKAIALDPSLKSEYGEFLTIASGK
jgi:tetratricopeptide (TPR) repeat protein